MKFRKITALLMPVIAGIVAATMMGCSVPGSSTSGSGIQDANSQGSGIQDAGSQGSGIQDDASAAALLDTPVISKIANSPKGVAMNWDAVEGAELYRVFRRDSSGKWTRLGVTDQTGYIDKTAVSGSLYDYTVRCLSADQKQYTSDVDTDGAGIMCLDTPTLEETSSSSDGIMVEWGEVDGATGYYVYRKTTEGKWGCLGSVTGEVTSFMDTTAESDTDYLYTVRAFHGQVESGFHTDGISGTR